MCDLVHVKRARASADQPLTGTADQAGCTATLDSAKDVTCTNTG